ncbi:MAG: BamA/TamA family outer membrane protein [Ferruginibacter sp.]
MLFNFLKSFFFISVIFSSCIIPTKVQKGKPYVFDNRVEINGGDFTNEERNSLKQKLYTLLDDSMKTNMKDIVFAIHILKSPPAYDSGYAGISARNMKASLIHLGYYNAKADFKADTIKYEKQQRVIVKYTINTGPPTRIDTMEYRFKKEDMQELALREKDKSFLKKPEAVTRVNVLSEISRMVELYRNTGYYKLTPDDLKLLGDTTIEALTNISDDPFENLQKLAEASAKRNKPTIKLAMIQNTVADSNRLKRYYIGNIFVYPDMTPADLGTTPKMIDTSRSNGNFFMWYHKKIFKRSFLQDNIYFKKDSLYSQADYNKTISNFSRLGVWQNVNIDIKERADSSGKLDMLIQLVPAKKYGFESNIEASYSSNSNTNNVTVANAGNLLGFSGNVSLQNRNFLRQGIKMTHAIRAGIELNLNKEIKANQRINSSEISYSNTIAFPKLIFPFKSWNRNPTLPANVGSLFKKWLKRDLLSKQSFVNFNVSSTNRIGLFKLFSLGLSAGNSFSFRAGENFTVKLPNIEFTNLYDRTEDFDKILVTNPFLRYSYNTALVIGASASFTKTYLKPSKPDVVRTLNVNLEESGYLPLPLDQFSIFKKDLRKFVKLDAEFVRTKTMGKSALVFRGFVGLGTPLGRKDTTLPFFKQYFAGGANSMRAWPIRSIGPGSKTPAGYYDRFFSDRTGDIRIEANVEYRFHIAQIIPNTLALKGALFADIGNVWNSRNTNADGSYDSAQIKWNFRDIYKELGVNLGTGFRFDFNYVVLRVDLGFRFKRPELSANDGWKAPSIGFDDFLKKIFTRGQNDEYRIWRYENFNFTIGLNYPF